MKEKTVYRNSGQIFCNTKAEYIEQMVRALVEDTGHLASSVSFKLLKEILDKADKIYKPE